jgi:hypothetical protein
MTSCWCNESSTYSSSTVDHNRSPRGQNLSFYGWYLPFMDENVCSVMIALTQSVMDYVNDERVVDDDLR